VMVNTKLGTKDFRKWYRNANTPYSPSYDIYDYSKFERFAWRAWQASRKYLDNTLSSMLCPVPTVLTAPPTEKEEEL